MRRELSDDAKAVIGGLAGFVVIVLVVGSFFVSAAFVHQAVRDELQERRVEACYNIEKRLTEPELAQCIDYALNPWKKYRRRDKEE